MTLWFLIILYVTSPQYGPFQSREACLNAIRMLDARFSDLSGRSTSTQGYVTLRAICIPDRVPGD